jgi:hypothetical protein
MLLPVLKIIKDYSSVFMAAHEIFSSIYTNHITFNFFLSVHCLSLQATLLNSPLSHKKVNKIHEETLMLGTLQNIKKPTSKSRYHSHSHNI